MTDRDRARKGTVGRRWRGEREKSDRVWRIELGGSSDAAWHYRRRRGQRRRDRAAKDRETQQGSGGGIAGAGRPATDQGIDTGVSVAVCRSRVGMIPRAGSAPYPGDLLKEHTNEKKTYLKGCLCRWTRLDQRLSWFSMGGGGKWNYMDTPGGRTRKLRSGAEC